VRCACRRQAIGGLARVDTDKHLGELAARADPETLADLRQHCRAPLTVYAPEDRDTLTELLRAWLLHYGRRSDIAAALFVHPRLSGTG
jgi:DNA-binding PucR family transcriptional regulator